MAVLELDLSSAVRRLVPSLVDEIAAAEAHAQRPALDLVMQERRAPERRSRAGLGYWSAEATSTDGAGARRIVTRRLGRPVPAR